MPIPAASATAVARPTRFVRLAVASAATMRRVCRSLLAICMGGLFTDYLGGVFVLA